MAKRTGGVMAGVLFEGKGGGHLPAVIDQDEMRMLLGLVRRAAERWTGCSGGRMSESVQLFQVASNMESVIEGRRVPTFSAGCFPEP